MFKKIIIILGLVFFINDAEALNKKVRQAKAKKIENVKISKNKKNTAKNSKKEEKLLTKTEPATCKSLLLIDAKSGQEIFESSSHQPLAPASVTKLMTTYVVLKQIKEGKHNLSDIITVSGHSSKIGGSQVYLKENEQFTLEELLNALLIQSANDAAVAIAEFVGGSVENFVDYMNQEAKSLGMSESEFHSPHGLPPAEGQKPDLASAHDLGILTHALINNFPEIINFTSKSEADFRNAEFKMNNHNHLLKSFPGCDGLKTGYYAEAGYSIAATAEKSGARVISIVMGCTDRKLRDQEAAKLLTQGFNAFKTVKLIDKGISIEENVKVKNGEKLEVSLITADSASVALRADEEKKITKKIDLCSNLEAPIEFAANCGTLSFLIDNKEIAKVDLLTAEAIKKAGLTQKLKQKIGL